MHHLEELTAKNLTLVLTNILESEQDLHDPHRHVGLMSLLNELAPLAFPPLITAARNLLLGKQTWMSLGVSSALGRICSGVKGNRKVSRQYFDILEEEYLFSQLESLLTDIEIELPLKGLSELEYLRENLWILATRRIIELVKVNQDLHLKRLLVNASDEMGLILEQDVTHFSKEAISILAKWLRDCHLAGGELSIILPGSSHQVGISQLMKSGLLSDLRGVEKLTIDGYGALSWLLEDGEYAQGGPFGLDEVQAIDLKVLTKEDFQKLLQTKQMIPLLEKIKLGIADRNTRGELPKELYQMLRYSEQDKMMIFIAERCSHIITCPLKGKRVLTMVYIPAGTFWMGSVQDDAYLSETPQHMVKISQPFLLSQTPVTQGQWGAVMRSNVKYFQQPNVPISNKTWSECIEFCNELSSYQTAYRQIGKEVELSLENSAYRLPFEAEWEYAAKAGSEFVYAGSDEVKEVAHYYGYQYDEDIDFSKHVAIKKPNAWGLYDMSGYVDEWCNDHWNESAYTNRLGISIDPKEWTNKSVSRVARGGNDNDYYDDCRVSSRKRLEPHRKAGFRLLKPLIG